MEKEHPKAGVISSILAAMPLLGFLAIFLLSHVTNNGVSQTGNVLLAIALFVAPIVGLVLGIVSLFNKQKKRLLSIIGTVLNLGWIIALIWGYFETMKIVYR